MANIFRSKEVYKKVNKNESSYDRDVLIPVGEPAKPNSEYGVYVAGEYRPPYYTDGLTISSISSKHVTVVNYIDEYKNVKTPTTVAFDFESSEADFKFLRYTKESYDVSPTPTVSAFGFTSDPCTFNAYRYGRDYKDITPTPTTVAFGFIENAATFINKKQYKDQLNNQPEPGIQLEGITSQPATVTDVL